MPAPAGFKTFVAGAVLTATSDVQVYLMDQVVTVWADASARTSGLSSPAEGQVSYLKDTDKIYTYSGAAWVELSGFSWTGSTANGLATYGTASTVVAESTATYNGTTLQLTTSGGGLKLDGLASSDVNTLDDYEEGTFTPTLTAGTAGTFGLSTAEGTYTKVGRLVSVEGRVIVSSISTGPSPSGDCRIESLPFTPGAAGASSVYVRLLSVASTESFSGVQFASYARIYVRRQGATGSGDDWADKVAVGTQLFYSCTYSV